MRFGRYTGIERMAQGGLGEVWRGRIAGAHGFGRDVVIKRILGSFKGDAFVEGMFIKEAMVLSGLRHPNVVTVLDFGRRVDGEHFLVMELVDGVSVAHFLDDSEARLSIEALMFIGVSTCQGLAHVHAQSIVHKDVSPDNILVSRHGEVKITDFGVAARQAEFSAVIVGKIPYMSPEQARGAALDGRSDVYSLGASLYEAFCRYRVPGHEDFRRVADGYSLNPFVMAQLPAGLRTAVARALEVDPGKRWQSVADMERAIRAAARPEAIGLGERHLTDTVESICVSSADAEIPADTAGEETQIAVTRPHGVAVPVRDRAPRFLLALAAVAMASGCVGWLLHALWSAS